ncbi:MAG: nucleotide exchange factor GrpE [Alphaproteobacteria bacterium]|nr:nucleotide exchange factor GrpE [Alphaproteobacteria bacterium]
MTQRKKTKPTSGNQSRAKTPARKSAKRPHIEAVPLDGPDLDPETTLQTGKARAGDVGVGEAGENKSTAGDVIADDPGAKDRIVELETQLAEMKDQFLRARAETENVRRRGEKSREDALNYGSANFARDILSVSDNLRRALDALSAEALEKDEALKSLATGVELTEKELQAALERHGVTKIDAEGQKFDHNLHQAMMEIPGTEHPPGTVVQVLQVGYVIKDRLLRPAMVGIAKGDANNKPDDKTAKGSKLDTSA